MTQPTYPGFQGVVVDAKNPDSLVSAIRRLIQVVGLILTGKLNCTGSVTLTANAASTTVTDPRVSVFSFIDFDPTTANAAAELYGATMYVTAANRSNGSFVITHANAVSTDRTFKYVIIG